MNNNYEVGYAKPPANTRFKKGQSGNPEGRKKGSKNKLPALYEERLKSIVIGEAYRTIKVNDGNKQVNMSMAEAIIRSLAVTAAKGQARSQKIFLEMLSYTETDHKRAYDEYAQTIIEYKYSWQEEIERCQNLGITPPEPIPHPDDIFVDMRNGGITIKGPMNKEEKVKWDKFRQRKMDCRETIAECQKILREEPDCDYKQFIIDDMEIEQKFLDRILEIIPD